MKKMTDKKFEEWPFQVPNFANVGARLKGFAELFAKASSPEEALKIWKKCTRLIESVEDKITHVSVLFSLETTNKKYEKAMKKILNLSTFLTCGTDECRAWTFRNGMTAPQCAGIIHSDFEKGFIKAEIYKFEDFKTYGSELAVKEAGKLRFEGKDYVMQDGDVVFFRFNV